MLGRLLIHARVDIYLILVYKLLVPHHIVSNKIRFCKLKRLVWISGLALFMTSYLSQASSLLGVSRSGAEIDPDSRVQIRLVSIDRNYEKVVRRSKIRIKDYRRVKAMVVARSLTRISRLSSASALNSDSSVDLSNQNDALREKAKSRLYSFLVRTVSDFQRSIRQLAYYSGDHDPEISKTVTFLSDELGSIVTDLHGQCRALKVL
jgi:hypothetical protein